MKRVPLSFYFLLYAFTIFSQHSVKKAELDLASWNIKQEEIISLDTPWELYWNRLLSPSDFQQDSLLSPDLITKPGSWNDLHFNGQPTGGKGFATYRLLLKNLPATSLILDVYSVQTSCRVFVNDSLFAEVGKPGTTKESTEPMNRDLMIHLPDHVRDLQLVVQVANFHHRKGGFVQPFELGLASAVTSKHMQFYLLDVAESSALSIIGMFLFALYIFRRKDLSILYFALFCITLSFRPVIAVNYFFATIFPDISWALLLKMEYLAVLFPCLFMLLFIKKLFPEQLSDLVVRSFTVVLILKILVTILFPPSVFSWLIPPLLIIIPLGVLFFSVTIIRAMFAGVEGAKYAGVGLIVLLGSLILKVLVYSNVLPPIHVLITALDITFIFMMSLILGSRFSLQFAKVERLQQTTEIQHREIEQKKAAIEEKNKSIIDSINYAKRIQIALLPSEKLIDKTIRKTKK
jgi:hypothetical protein